jgi:hypothetical protein
MSRPTYEDTHRSSTDFTYEEILKDFWFEDASLKALFMKRHQVYMDRGRQAEVTTYGDYWITKFHGENYFPLHVDINVLGEDGTSLGRVDAEYQVCFYCFPIVQPDHFARLMEDRLLAGFWEIAGDFLCNAVQELGFDASLLQRQLPDLMRTPVK